MAELTDNQETFVSKRVALPRQLATAISTSQDYRTRYTSLEKPAKQQDAQTRKTLPPTEAIALSPRSVEETVDILQLCYFRFRIRYGVRRFGC